MPQFRPDVTALTPYRVGRQLDEVARAHGLEPSQIVKLTANEGPEGPFPGVVEAAAAALGTSNRYPDNDCWALGHTLAEELGVGFENLMFGAGATALLDEIATACGGPGTNVVYAWPSFVMYRFVTVWAGSERVEVPLDTDHGLDLDAMLSAIDEGTRVVIVCNPNNPTGTILESGAVADFVDRVPEHVTVVIDEAYHEFVTDPRYASAIPLAVERPNVLVLRTFSKIYGLAGHRIGYAVGTPELLTQVKKVQPPLTVSSVAQAAALASLGQPEELERRRSLNAGRRHHVVGALAERGLPTPESHTNFVYFEIGPDVDELVAEMIGHGVLIRAMGGGWARATIGDDEDNRRFLEALDAALDR